MKVLLVVSSYAPNTGGLQTVTSQLAKALLARGHEVVVITNRYPRALPAGGVLAGVQVIRWHFLAPQLRFLLSFRFDLFLAGFLYFPVTLARLGSCLRRECPDVVNLHFVGAPALFVLLTHWLMRFRLVVSMHGDDVEGLSRRGWFDRWVFRSLMRRADALTACSSYLLNEAHGFESSIAEKGRVIHNGIDSPPALAGKRGPFTVLAAGRMVAKKGFDVLLRAYAQGGADWRLTIIGDGPERERLQRLASDLGLNGQVKFCGSQPRLQVLEAMKETTLVVIPSRQEPFGIIALEAMALGKPVVASRVGGLPEVLEGADAVLVAPDNPLELAKAIGAVLERLRRDTEFGARSVECARRFSTELMVSRYLAAYIS